MAETQWYVRVSTAIFKPKSLPETNVVKYGGSVFQGSRMSCVSLSCSIRNSLFFVDRKLAVVGTAHHSGMGFLPPHCVCFAQPSGRRFCNTAALLASKCLSLQRREAPDTSSKSLTTLLCRGHCSLFTFLSLSFARDQIIG